MTDRVLSARALNRAMLARQLLLERATLSIPAALEAVAGLQDQYAPTAYIGLWSRLRDLPREALTGALERREVVQATLMRSTIHLVSAADYWPFARGTMPARRAWWFRVRRTAVEGIDIGLVERRVREALAGGPRRHAEMVGAIDAAGLPPIAWSMASQLLDMVRVPPSGTWQRRRADLYGLAEWWLGSNGSAVSESEGLVHLVRRYLGGFGPAGIPDIASWAGLPTTVVRRVVGEMSLRRFRDERRRELLDVPDGALPDEGTPAPVRFLSNWEALLLVHARRTEVLPERYRSLVFNTRMPQSMPTVLVDGAVAGTWRYDADARRVLVEPFGGPSWRRDLAARVRRELDDEAERLAAFHAG